MTLELGIVIGLAVLGVVVFLLSFQPVAPGFRGVRLWWGSRILIKGTEADPQYQVDEEGWHFVVPIIGKIMPIDCREQYAPIPSEDVYTKEGIHVSPQVEVYYRVTNPDRIIGLSDEILSVDNEEGLVKVAQAGYRAIIATRDLQSCRDANGKRLLELELLLTLGGLQDPTQQNEYRLIRQAIGDPVEEPRLTSQIEEGIAWAKRWGIKVTGVKVSDIEPTKDVIELMAKEKKAVLAGDAEIAVQKKAAVSEREKADYQLYVAQQAALGKTADLMAPVNARITEATRMKEILGEEGYQQLLRTKALEAFGTSPSTKIIVPASGLSQMVGEGVPVLDALRGATGTPATPPAPPAPANPSPSSGT